MKRIIQIPRIPVMPANSRPEYKTLRQLNITLKVEPPPTVQNKRGNTLVGISFDERLSKFELPGGRWVDGVQYATGFQPGAAWWMRSTDGQAVVFKFICPCGCGMVGHVPIQPHRKDGWAWDGSLEKPTLNPSILSVFGCKWHGYMTKGEWVSV